MALCIGKTKDELEALILRIREDLSIAGYSCAFGLSTGKPVKDMIREADNNMYEDKARIKKEILASCGMVHGRED